ncbi:uncharacterized protein LOC123309549 [Coccinella septempunctata]|uniref:uncharacterized protein LOC123309549 n=1 Tax=Coccinella septempunctata TaxID=41139 RepID=UPI001D08348D|nr:uncharacterized protein LOC123309549 [Coccinella septempunctata]
MEDPKNRGRKHLLNKSKYSKNKLKTGLSKPVTKSKSLVPNWDRYEEELTSINDYVPLGSDFSQLANAPISKGSHFQFKEATTKIQDIERSPADTSGLFNIDLNLIGLSLSTIPFNERCGIPDEYFSVAQQNIMMQTAKNNEKIYEQTLLKEGIDIKSNIDEFMASKEPTSYIMKSRNGKNRTLQVDENLENVSEDYRAIEDKVTRGNNSEISTLGNEIGELSLDKNSSSSEGVHIESASSILETETLQQWLDDVLGD